ncbi:hypothetical protein JMJ35_004622 [Cladonia borealis]|uniref:AIG1-type G domain-containing protein n=1 Tax=Cladonia borealis TaxID=184061 RepID=A0AA39R0J2_9LECA|nr:hypothetical protein JMJ35_004622 [Cladonia borealis]
MSTRSNTISIAVIGEVGAGKSAFINQVAGSRIPLSNGNFCVSRELKVVSTKIQSKNVYFIDTPNFDDTSFTDTKVLESIVALLQAYSKEDIKLSASQFPTSSGPVDPSSRRVSRSDGSKASALRIVQEVMQSEATIPQIKRELEACTALSDTSAGSAIVEELRAFKEDKRREIESLQEDLLRNPKLAWNVNFMSYIADVERQKAEAETKIERWGQPIGEYLKAEIQASTAGVLSSGAKCAII